MISLMSRRTTPINIIHPVNLSYFSLPHFSLGKKSKRKMWERKIRIAQAGAKL
jgi:hypothetical protein